MNKQRESLKLYIKSYIKPFIKYLLIPVIALVAGILGEVAYNLPFDKQDGYYYIPFENIEMDNFTLEGGSVFVSGGGEASLAISFPKQYVDKFTYCFSYDNVHAMSCDLEIRTYPGEESNTEVIRDTNNYVLKNSTVNIRKVTDHIIIKMSENSSPVQISLIAIDNMGNYSWYRAGFLALCTFLILSMIVIWKKKIAIRLEVCFLVIVLSVGSLTILALPSHKVGFDEEIHFGRAYFFSEIIAGQETIEYPWGIDELITTSLSNWPLHLPESEEEIKEEDARRNYACNYAIDDEGGTWVSDDNYSLSLSTYCYVFQWAMLKVGMILGLPFVWIFKMGRMANLLLYATLMYFAIRHLKKGKRILFVLALMPANMLTAMTYSYDAWVNGFAFLGTAYLLEECFGESEKISYKNWCIFTVAILLASLPKAVYSPLLLLAVLVPARKFRSKREMYLLKSVSALAGVLMMGTFMLPALTNPKKLGGDSRGGDTSVARQLKFIFSNPVYYAKMLLESIKDTFLSYSIGIEGLGRMGHLVKTASEPLMIFAVSYTVLTDWKCDDNSKNDWKKKAAILFICFAILCLIWTALYLSFTPVGLNKINGVQGRYYLPVTVWILWALRSSKVKNYLKQSTDYMLLTAISLLILLPTIYINIIFNTF